MTRTELVAKIAQEVDMPKPDVRKVIKAFEDSIMEIIALEDNVEFTFGKIEGYTRPPRKVTGIYRTFDCFQKNGHWSPAKIGYPKCTFSKEAMDCLRMEPKDFFEDPEYRYTSNARQFRKDNNLSEIPEYEGLDEEKILELCDRADFIRAGKDGIDKGKYNKNLKSMQRVKEKQERGYEQEYLQKQREAGVPEDQLVFKSYEELIEEKYAKMRQNQLNYLSTHPSLRKVVRRLEKHAGEMYIEKDENKEEVSGVEELIAKQEKELQELKEKRKKYSRGSKPKKKKKD